jgi:hypothetical protein
MGHLRNPGGGRYTILGFYLAFLGQQTPAIVEAPAEYAEFPSIYRLRVLRIRRVLRGRIAANLPVVLGGRSEERC